MNFLYATVILRARLRQTNRVDINVFEECIAQATPDMNSNNGRIFCYFFSRPDDSPVLLAFIREHIDQNISHIIAFYVNKKFKIIQPTERKRFAKKLQEGARLGLEVKLGVVNAETDIPKFSHTSILIQMAEFMLDISLAKNFVPTKQVTRCVFSSFVCFNPQIPFPNCDPTALTSNAEITGWPKKSVTHFFQEYIGLWIRWAWQTSGMGVGGWTTRKSRKQAWQPHSLWTWTFSRTTLFSMEE